MAANGRAVPRIAAGSCGRSQGLLRMPDLQTLSAGFPGCAPNPGLLSLVPRRCLKPWARALCLIPGRNFLQSANVTNCRTGNAAIIRWRGKWRTANIKRRSGGSSSIVGVAVIALVIVAVAATRGGTKIDPTKLAKVEQGDFAKSVVATGKVTPITKVEIKSKASGIVKKLYVDTGDKVKQARCWRSSTRRDHGAGQLGVARN